MRLIDADELKGKAFADPDDGEYFVYCQNIDEAPTVDAVPVVRCRECKFWEPYGGKGSRNGAGPLELEGGCMKWRGRHLESDFCSYGERMENANRNLSQEA